jgi:hypothetical protein
MMKWLFVLLAALGVLAAPAGADEYWLTYEGNDLPENEGWERHWGNDDGSNEGDGAIRTVENGILTMDSLYDLRVYDYACRYPYGEVDPEPGELFIAQWRVMVAETIGDGRDSMLVIASDGAMQLAFGLFPDYIESKWEDDVTLPVTPGMFHDYRVLSWDMETYELYIDGDLMHEGTFWQGLLDSKLAWGDGVRGAASLAHWDYVHFGVVPEPCSILMLIALCVYARRNRAQLFEEIQ